VIKSHKDLEVYKTSMDFVVLIYRLTQEFPKEEEFGLSSQMRRASVSIVSNISEGAARNNTKQFIQFLYYSLGSASELETQIELAKRIGFINDESKDIKTLHYIISMLSGLIKSLKQKL
jgi:four helix bundle protein